MNKVLSTSRGQALLGPQEINSAEARSSYRGPGTSKKGVLPSKSLLLVPNIEGSSYPSLEDLLGEVVGPRVDLQKGAQALPPKAAEGIVTPECGGVGGRAEPSDIIQELNPALAQESADNCKRSAEERSTALAASRPSPTEQFLQFVESSLDLVEAVAARMKTDLRISAVSTWDFAVQCLHVFVFIVLRYMLRAMKILYIGHLLCLVGLGSTYAAVVAEIEGKIGTVSSGFGDAEKEESEGVNRKADGQAKKGLLPPQAPEHKDKMTVVLDLDETLVCAYNSAGLPSSIHQHAAQNGVRWFQLQCTANEMDENGKPKVNLVTVYERPGLAEFLRRASVIGELVLFTAGLEGYARPLVDKIDPEGMISARLYRPATVSTKYREHVKDLSALGRDLRKTVLVDNNPFSFILQPVNGIPCVPFTGEQPEDRQLLEVLLPLLESLSKQPDIRPVLLDRYRMPAWFKMRGFSPPENNFGEPEIVGRQAG
ncbi:hypothetical protein KFL_005940020 [Klebsormidium nitens]|uniref:FCP1 homology domain-containing protein n=1 Tax=Klebsormidium nitens TaxID=105231 RepID=A0A1Y1IN65_KLENI|nr:hypothetical protein KFL_005940020 [Klebsormidium nitens]|eukprot:GAQ90057.1 hypothetical protein KFL_005940020 [Klebsormidium nitens]